MVRIVLSAELKDWESLLAGRRDPESKREHRFIKVVKALLERRNLGELRSLGKPYFEPLGGDLEGFYSAYLRESGPNVIRLIMTVKVVEHDDGKKIMPSLPDKEPLVYVKMQMIDEEHYKELKKRLRNGWEPE